LLTGKCIIFGITRIKEEEVVAENKPDKPEEGTTAQPAAAKAEAAAGPEPKISMVDRSVLPKTAPELTPEQMQQLRSKLQNKFH
jgi:hypothetical protein